MNISARLRTIASLVKDNSSIVDVGCDHGLLDIYLTKYKNVRCVASDNKASCLNNAISNIKKYNLEDKIKTILCDGVEGIDLDTIVEATNIINPLLDEYDLISEEYVLDISSKERG